MDGNLAPPQSVCMEDFLPTQHVTVLQETGALARCILMCQPSGHLEAVSHRTAWESFVIWILKDILKDRT